ncbi:MAG: hypothetical protein GYB65_14835 [Chloroflexi bacterium]|nr:hypothetical protein [Chloroflexota bacterium]
MTIDTERACNTCGKTFTIRSIIAATAWYWPALDVAVSATPCCQFREELRLNTGQVLRGYVYAAGTAHFADMETYAAPDLIVNHKDATGLTFTLDGVTHTIQTKP